MYYNLSTAAIKITFEAQTCEAMLGDIQIVWIVVASQCCCQESENLLVAYMEEFGIA